MSWDTSVPANSDFISQGASVIRTLKSDLQGALRGQASDGDEAKFPGSDTANPVYRYRGLKGSTASRPAAGEYGLYINTTLNSLQRDSGVAWEDVATLFPAGTKMVFYQASAPTGWTAVAVNDKFLRVVTAGGTGGTDGGTVAASTSLAHTHTVAAHTHTTPAHQHPLDTGSTANTSNGSLITYAVIASASSVIEGRASDGSVAGTSPKGQTTSSGSGTSGSASPATDSQFAGAFAYSDVIIATKD